MKQVKAAHGASCVRAPVSVWYRGDVGLTLSGSNVVSWADLSGNGLNLTPIATAPTSIVLNGLTAVNFDSSGSQSLNIGSPPFGGAGGLASVCAVAACSSWPPPSNASRPAVYSLWTSTYCVSINTLGYYLRAWELFDGADYIGGSIGPYNTSQAYSLIAINDGTTLSGYVNNDDTGRTGGTASLPAVSDLYLGVSPSILTYFDGVIGEMLVYNAALSDDDRTTIYTIHRAVWGL